MAKNLTLEQITPWVETSLEKVDIKDYAISLTGTSEKGEGYATDVVFVTVTGTKKSSATKVELYLVLKVGKEIVLKDFEHFRKLYGREIFIYDYVFPEFKKFEALKQVKQPFTSVAKCIKTLEGDGRDIIVLENLRKQGYVPHDRLLPMNINHIKMVLKNYAQFHATGFAFRDQMKPEFENLTKDYFNALKELGEFYSMFESRAKKIRDDFEKIDPALAKNIDGLIEKGILSTIFALYDEDIPEVTITHGDCWNSNFLFKYDGDSRDNPSEVAILDWQLSSLYSPTIDLAYFMFIVSSTEQVAEFENLLEYYYEHLCNNIRELGSDPEKVFPHSTFRQHWKRYSLIGLVFVFTILEFVLVDKDDVHEFTEFDDKEKMEELWLNIKPKNTDLYLERVTSVCRYYFNLIDN